MFTRLEVVDLVEFGSPEISDKYLEMVITTPIVSRIPMGQEIIRSMNLLNELNQALH